MEEGYVNVIDGDCSTYEGECLNGKRHGRGTSTWPDGSRFEGDWVDGKKHGQGIYTWPNGNRFEGDYRDDKRHGRGIMTNANKDRYEGEYFNGERHGRGTSTWADRSRFEGDWVDGKKHGQGIYTWPNGNRFEGAYRDGKRHGRGIMTDANKDRYDGEYLNGERHGRGIFTNANKDMYDGDFNEGTMHGIGTYSAHYKEGSWGPITWAQGGWTYCGTLERDRPTEGELVEADGRLFKVTYAKDCARIWENPNAKTKERLVAPLAKAAADKKKELLKKELDTAAEKAVAASKAAGEAAAGEEDAAAAAFFSKASAEAAVAEKENPVKVWLRKISLAQYSAGIVDFGYDSMDALLRSNEKDVIEMTEEASIGMKKPHRTLFLNAWKALLKTSLSPQRTFASKEEEFENMIAEYDPSSGILSKDQFTKFCRAIQNGSNPFESPVGAGKFCAEPKEMKMGDFQQAAGGLFKLMNVNKKETLAKALLGGVPAVKEEVENLKTNKKFSKYYPLVSKYLNYILYEPASEQPYPYGIRDKGRAGITLSYFAEHLFAKQADLDEAEVVALRLYTTPAFVAINEPLRNLEEGVEHPLPLLVTILAEALRKMRQIGANDMAAVQEKILWRGMKNIKPSDEFTTLGGTELAPMSTTTDIKTAVEYSLSSESLIFMIVTKNALQRGASLSWLSAFPTEEEICFPPLTYLQPTGRKQVVEINGMRFTIVEVAPSN